jgi:hypothetical protein
MTTHVLLKADFKVQLALDDETGRFNLICEPPFASLNEGSQRKCVKWFRSVCRGWAIRQRIQFSEMRVEFDSRKCYGQFKADSNRLRSDAPHR